MPHEVLVQLTTTATFVAKMLESQTKTWDLGIAKLLESQTKTWELGIYPTAILSCILILNYCNLLQ